MLSEKSNRGSANELLICDICKRTTAETTLNKLDLRVHDWIEHCSNGRVIDRNTWYLRSRFEFAP
jgi:hypothetical protein